MDILSHGLWGGIALGRRSRRSFWAAFGFGVAPDLCSFGLVFADGLITHGLDFFNGLGHPPDAAAIPAYVYTLYNLTHSLVVFAAVFALVWALRGRPLWALGAWGLHIAVDIFTHSAAFFPTPFLWPLSDLRVDGVPWSEPRIFFSNVLLLAVAYGWLWWQRRKAAAAPRS
jgi:membrane-bound metal-dependent hydrolase YbcI (DUF457 family)